jgi:cellulose 1,4-beta-cellobiosidase
MSEALQKGIVLVMSFCDDHYANMHWLDSTLPNDTKGKPGAERGECPTSGGGQEQVESSSAGASVTFSNINFRDILSTFAADKA